MAWAGLTLTVDGRNALNQAQAANRMDIKSVVVGDGVAPSNFRTMKGLVHQLFELTELKIDIVDGRCVLTVDFPKVDYDYYFREIGVMVTTGDGDVLYVYDNCGDDAQYVVTSTGVEETQKRIRISLLISDVANISVTSPSILYVGFDEFDAEVVKLRQAEEDIAALQERTDKLESGKVDKAGDTMTGNLIIGGHGGTNTPAIGWKDKLHFLWAGIKNDEGMFFFWDDTRQENIISKATNGHGEAWGGNHVAIFTNSEGGNIMIEGPSNTQHWEMDNWNDNQFRIYCREGSANYFPFTLSKDGIIGRLIGTADNALRLKDAGGSLYNIGAQYSGELSSAEWLCAWHDLGNNDIRIRAVKNSNISVGWASASQNSNTCGGLFPDHNVSVNSIVTRNASGYSFFNYINSNTSNNENPVISQVIVTNGGDGYYRKASLAHLKSALGIQGYLPLIGGHITGEVTMAASLFVNYVRPQNGSTLHLMGNGFLNLQSPGIQCRNWDDTGWSGISASGFHNQSSCRYKKNIMPMAKERAEKILGVEVCTYDYKDNIVDENQHNRTGVIAERVAEIVPEAVSYREIDGLGNVPDSVDYTRFIPYLIKMTQMQQKEIEKLKSDKQRMEERLDTIEETLGIAGKDGTT